MLPRGNVLLAAALGVVLVLCRGDPVVECRKDVDCDAANSTCIDGTCLCRWGMVMDSERSACLPGTRSRVMVDIRV